MKLRQLTFNDFPVLEAWSKRPELSEYFRRLPPSFMWSSPQSFQQYLGNSFLIENDERVLGLTCFSNVDHQNKKFECGILIDLPTSEERRVASLSAYDQAFDYFFNHLGFKRAECSVLRHRVKLAEWLVTEGWRVEGISRSSAFVDGKFEDEIRLSYLAEDYHGRSTAK